MPLGHRSIAVGDRFVRVGQQPAKIYLVRQIDQRPHQPPHARLVAEADDAEQITIGVSALADPKLFRRVTQ